MLSQGIMCYNLKLHFLIRGGETFSIHLVLAFKNMFLVCSLHFVTLSYTRYYFSILLSVKERDAQLHTCL